MRNVEKIKIVTTSTIEKALSVIDFGAVKIVVDIIKGFDLDGILKKTFYDL